MIEIDKVYNLNNVECHALYESNSAFWRVWAEGLGYLGIGLSLEEAVDNACINPKLVFANNTVTSGCAVNL